MFWAMKVSPPDQTTDFGVSSPVTSCTSERVRSAAVLPSGGTSVVVVVVVGAGLVVVVVDDVDELAAAAPSIRSDGSPLPSVHAAASIAPTTPIESARRAFTGNRPRANAPARSSCGSRSGPSGARCSRRPYHDR